MSLGMNDGIQPTMNIGALLLYNSYAWFCTMHCSPYIGFQSRNSLIVPNLATNLGYCSASSTHACFMPLCSHSDTPNIEVKLIL